MYLKKFYTGGIFSNFEYWSFSMVECWSLLMTTVLDIIAGSSILPNTEKKNK